MLIDFDKKDVWERKLDREWIFTAYLGSLRFPIMVTINLDENPRIVCIPRSGSRNSIPQNWRSLMIDFFENHPSFRLYLICN